MTGTMKRAVRPGAFRAPVAVTLILAMVLVADEGAAIDRTGMSPLWERPTPHPPTVA